MIPLIKAIAAGSHGYDSRSLGRGGDSQEVVRATRAKCLMGGTLGQAMVLPSASPLLLHADYHYRMSGSLSGVRGLVV